MGKLRLLSGFLFYFMNIAKGNFFLSALINFKMLNVRIIKGGCRGREAAKFGLVGFKANVFLQEGGQSQLKLRKSA